MHWRGVVDSPVLRRRLFDAVHLTEHVAEVHPQLGAEVRIGLLDGLLVRENDLVPVAGRLREPLDVLAHDLLRRHCGESLEILLERGLGRAETLLVEQTRFAQERDLGIRLHVVEQTNLIDPNQLTRVVGLLVDR